MSRRLLALALRAYPKRRRKRDGAVLLATARDLIDDGSTVRREVLGLVRGGLSARVGSFAIGFENGPWREALDRLAAPVAGLVLAVWTVAYVTFAGSGRFYPAVLAAAAVTFIGALTRIRLLALGGWLSLCALVAYATVYSQQHLQTGSRFGSGAWTVGIDMVAAFAPLTVLGLLSAFALRGEPRLRDATWLSPAIALSALQSTWTPETGQPWAHLLLLCGLFAAPFLAACVWRGRVGMGAAALLGAVAAPEAVWLSTALGPGTIGALVMLCVLGLTAAACVVLLGRRAQRTHTEPASN